MSKPSTRLGTIGLLGLDKNDPWQLRSCLRVVQMDNHCEHGRLSNFSPHTERPSICQSIPQPVHAAHGSYKSRPDCTALPYPTLCYPSASSRQACVYDTADSTAAAHTWAGMVRTRCRWHRARGSLIQRMASWRLASRLHDTYAARRTHDRTRSSACARSWVSFFGRREANILVMSRTRDASLPSPRTPKHMRAQLGRHSFKTPARV
ncbi:hypothetical protein BD413DRAFT_3710 [Trametes elegans]|nr:hypothetical protein BD413DRAFT_3710 [Trametes elegans]